MAAPALSGIPVTHRGLASGFVVVSGHAESAYRPVLEALGPASLTVVVLMGLASRSAIASVLIARGWNGTTPAAICLAAGTTRAQTWVGRLDALGTAPLAMGSADDPGTIVIGDVVTVGRQMAHALFGPSPAERQAA